MAIRFMLWLPILIASAFEAGAAELIKIRATASETVYVDQELVTFKSGRAIVFSVWDLAEPRTNGFAEEYRSVAVRTEYDCTRRTGRVVGVAEFASAMAQGEALRTYSDFDRAPDPLPAGSVGLEIYEWACPLMSAQNVGAL